MDAETQQKIHQYIKKYTKTDLQDMCRKEKMTVNGTKQDLVMRLLRVSVPKADQVSTPVKTSVLKIKKNEYGNYTHEESQMVFDRLSRKVIAVQLPGGGVRPLQRCDIDICQKYKFQYVMPAILDPSPVYEILENSDHTPEEAGEDNEEEDEEDTEDVKDDV